MPTQRRSESERRSYLSGYAAALAHCELIAQRRLDVGDFNPDEEFGAKQIQEIIQAAIDQHRTLMQGGK